MEIQPFPFLKCNKFYNLSDMSSPIKIIDSEIAYMEFYDNYVISSIKEDIIFDIEELHYMVNIMDDQFPDKNFGYIANRIYSYNMNPVTYPVSSIHERLSAMAIVCYSDVSRKTALFEKDFFKKPFEVFDEIEEAKKWLQEILKK